jgi:hypothetical protein
LSDRLNKVVVGLALKNELYNKRLNQTLFDLYSRPEIDAIKDLHDRLISSNDHFDREVAFWLELALQQPPVQIDLQDVSVELTEMEVLLYDLVLRANSESQRNLNDWMNYIANVPQSIRDGNWIDAKILMSLAVQSSRKESIERIKRDPQLRYKIEVLQKETSRLFEVTKRIPLRLIASEERLCALEKILEVLIELLQRYNFERPQERLSDMIRYSIQKLEASQRSLMRSNIKTDDAKNEIIVASKYLEQQMSVITNINTLEWMKSLLEKIRVLVHFLEQPR